ncbi:MAG TPA: lysylphosphatidylglycerol synthase transmembrane domain-containing protein, partial [Aggregatilineales bacterium]|nr:lysylphosphatidylglycerol synthase transmembrane domain-containing protein [Aggregatilineales bacterium]
SIVSWTVEASTYWIVLHAFDFRVSFWVLMLVLGLANLTTILPSTPGYVGTFHAAVVLTLEAFDVNGESAGAYAIVMHMVLWLPITLAGAVLLWKQGMNWRDLGRASIITESKTAVHDTV